MPAGSGGPNSAEEPAEIEQQLDTLLKLRYHGAGNIRGHPLPDALLRPAAA